MVGDEAEQFLLGVSVTVSAGAVGIRDALLRFVVSKQLDQRVDIIGRWILGLFQRRRVCHDAHHLLLERLAFVENADGIIIALRHFPPVYAGYDGHGLEDDRKSTRLNSSHVAISYAVFCWKTKKL